MIEKTPLIFEWSLKRMNTIKTRLMKQLLILCLLVSSVCINTLAQQTIGVFTNTIESFNGYTLFGPAKSKDVYLIDNCGEKVHSWTSKYVSGSPYLLEDGTLLKTGGSGAEMIDWNNNSIWQHSVSQSHGQAHHDIEILPNGNILLIVYHEISQADVALAGGNTTNTSILSEQIIEIKPDIATGQATVVWEWKVWDHLIQDVDNALATYGNISENPEKIDLNFINLNRADWLHINAVHYNEELDQIMLSVHDFGEIWILDHSTTTSEAADTTGGKYGKGGGLLYRWGNPRAYDQGSTSDQKLFGQHNTHWIADGLPDAGKILLYNNQAGSPVNQDYSTVNTFELPVDANGFYSYSGGAYGPTDFSWTYKAPNPTDFFSGSISGVQRLENGNTLICEGVGGRLFEIDASETIVWEYINPANNLGPIVQGVVPQDNNVFRCLRYAADYAAFDGKTLTPQGYIEIGSTITCDLFLSGNSSVEVKDIRPLVQPNPAQSFIRLNPPNNTSEDLVIKIYNLNGQLLIHTIRPKGSTEIELDINELSNGIYFVVVSSYSDVWTEKFMVSQ